jgi:ribosomal protein S18 acetylase RimI-like enzyme
MVPNELNDIVIIELDPARWNEYRALRLDALRTDPAAFGASLHQNEGQPPEYWQQRLRQARKRSGSWLTFAERQGTLVGMVGAMIKDQPDEAELISMWVRPEFRGLGIGRLLVDSQLRSLRSDPPGAKQVYLTVYNSQTAAIALYRAAGFRVVQDDGLQVKMMKSNRPLVNARNQE